MKRLSRDTKLGIGILILLIAVTVFAATQKKTAQVYPRLSSISSAPNGALALKLWVEKLGYEVSDNVLTKFAPPANASIVFMLEPSFPTEDDMKAIDKWVEAGNTLILIGEQYGMFSAADHYDFTLNYRPNAGIALKLEAPILLSPSAFTPNNVNTNFTLDSKRDDYVVEMTSQGLPVLVSFEQGRGRIILGTISDAFTNVGLKQEGNPELVLNILALAKDKGTVWFDEWHHGVQSGEEILGPTEFLRRTPIGRALVFIVIAIAIVFFMQGRGFGRPVPLPQEIRRRGAIEHVTGIANLSRRAAHRSVVMMNYHQQIKRKLGQRYRLDPGMDDAEYVNKLFEYNPAIDKNELLNLLKRLRRKDLNETEMVHLAGEASKWIDG
ncbi:MAG: DUF4350 domain-containing protein [Anaerolineales bacterium]|nr:DUF4350 domain-containing protein [Anaerolineales bacterium]